MTAEPAVLIEGRLAAWARRGRYGCIALSYEEAWRRAPDAFPLSLSMPLTGASHGNNVLEPYPWGLLPDNNAALEGWSRRFHVSARNPFSLLARVGEDCAGAVQVVRPERLDACLSARPEPPQLLEPGEVAARLRLLRSDPSATRRMGDPGQFSLAGAQPKTAFLRRGGQWYVPAGRTPTTHILKPPLAVYPGHIENEHFCAVLARGLGLPTAKTEVLGVGGEVAVVVERYDRRRTGRGLRRIHQEDMRQAPGILPMRKYQNDGGPGIGDIAGLLRTHSSKRGTMKPLSSTRRPSTGSSAARTPMPRTIRF